MQPLVVLDSGLAADESMMGRVVERDTSLLIRLSTQLAALSNGC